jgi:ATP-dependent Clp protease protease subunit
VTSSAFRAKLLRDNIIFLDGPIDDHVANLIIAQMLFLQSEDPKKDISFYVNSPGGSVTAGLAIIDTMNHIKNDVSTVAVGLSASMGALILSSGKKGKRLALPNAEVMIHQPLGGIEGQASDIEISAKNIIKTRENLNKLLSKNTGQPISKIEKDVDRNFWMSAEEAKKYGIVEKFQTILNDEIPAIFLYSPRYQYIINKDIKGVRVLKLIQPSDRFATLSEWYSKTKLVWK